MSYLQLAWAMVLRRKAGTILTLLSVLAAFLLFGLLECVRDAVEVGAESIAGVERLITAPKVGLSESLPKKLLPRLQAIPGVEQVSYENWFGGTYQDREGFFANEAIAAGYLDLHPELVLAPDQRRAFHDTQTGAIAGEALAGKFNWKLGDRISLRATRFPQKNGSDVWTFDLVGIYHVADPELRNEEQTLYFNWDYLDRARQTGTDSVGWYVLRIADRMGADRVAQAIDALSVNSDHETRTQSERAFNASLLGQMGDIRLIVRSIMGAVFLTLVILTANTASQAVRERTPELAILKALGFPDSSVLTLVLAETVVLVLLGGAFGLIVAGLAVRATSATGIPVVPVTGAIWARGMELAAVVGLVVGAIPAFRGLRLQIVDGLSGR